MANAKIQPITLIVLEMKNAGQKQKEWSDDDNRWKVSGPQYVRIVAKNADDNNSFVRLEVPASTAKQFRIGEQIAIHATYVTCVTNVTKQPRSKAGGG